MGEKEDKERAEKIAAAKKKVAASKKKKAAAASEKSGAKKTIKEEDIPKSHTEDTFEADDAVPAEENEDAENELENRENAATDPDETTFNNAIKEAAGPIARDNGTAAQSPDDTTPPDQDAISNGKTRGPHGRQPSLSLQSKLRSSSFRQTTAVGSLPPLSPDGETLPDIYRKQATRLEELERDNKRLVKEVSDGEIRWRKSEEELEELREGSVENEALKIQATKAVNAEAEVLTLRAEVAALTRERAQRKSTGERRGSSHATDETGLRNELSSRDATIADMELEISRLRSQINTQTQGCDKHGEQITALQVSLSTAETKLKSAESELVDTKKSLARATEKAVHEGTERTSKDTKIRSLEREMAEAIAARDEVVKKAEGLEKKVEAMNKLHREAEARNASKLATAEASSREAGVLKAKLASIENENLRMKEDRERRKKRSLDRGAGEEDGLDELEDEEREKLEKRIRDLEGEVFELRRGVWRDRRRDLQDDADGEPAKTGDEAEFEDVNLSGPGSRRRSFANTLTSQQQKHSGFSQVLNSGLAAFRATTTSPDSQQRARPRNDSLLEEFDDEAGFDEFAFAQAQREEEARKMVEHVREVKRKLKEWEGWRLDMVDMRRASGGELGFGDIFEV